jgi:pimeloyl-ACP methyl ester carboxylesterase
MQSAIQEENKLKSDLTTPYYMFKFSIRSELTRKYYERRIRRFFDFIEFNADKDIEQRCNEFAEKSGPPAWNQLPTWYQISESDLMIPPDAQRQFAKQMNATTISINASHASYVSHPDEIAKLILDAIKGSTK